MNNEPKEHKHAAKSGQPSLEARILDKFPLGVTSSSSDEDQLFETHPVSINGVDGYITVHKRNFPDPYSGEPTVYGKFTAVNKDGERLDPVPAALSEENLVAFEEMQKEKESKQREVGGAALDGVVVQDSLGQGANLVAKKAEVSDMGSIEKKDIKLKPENIEAAEKLIEIVMSSRLSEVFGDADDPKLLREMLDPNTGSEEARLYVTRLARNIIDQLGDQSKLPERVQENSPDNLKNIPDTRFGYDRDKYRSRDYAALLVLARLDGSFNVARLLPTQENRGVSGSSLSDGQHRQAAEMVLDVLHQESEASSSNSIENVDSETEDGLSEEEKVVRHQIEARVSEVKDLFARSVPAIEQVCEQYSNGLPGMFNTDAVAGDFMAATSRMNQVVVALSDVAVKMRSHEDIYSPEDTSGILATKYELEEVTRTLHMLGNKVSELQYDQNAVLETVSYLRRELPNVMQKLHYSRIRLKN